MDTTTLDKIQSLSATVAADHDALVAAVGEEREAAAALLDAVVAKARPALRALASRIVKLDRTWWPDNAHQTSDETHHDERGVRLVGDGPEEDHPRANSGQIEGRDLYLLTDGTFAEVTWSGTWSRWQGAGSRRESDLARYPTSRAVVDDGWRVGEIVEALAVALERHARGEARATAKAARARAERLAALSKLL